MTISAGLPPDVLASLRARGPKCVCHITAASRLPDIAASGGLLSPRARDEPSDRWGANKDIGEAFVCCGFQPHWGVLKHFGAEESAILVFDAASTAALPGSLLSPHNTASREARPFLLGQDEDPASTLDRCRADRRSAELLIRESVPLSSLRFVIFCDSTARDAWWPATLRALGSQAPRDLTALLDGTLGGFRFPPGFGVTNRVRPVAAGVDRRPAEPMRDSPLPVDPTSTVEDLIKELWEEEPDEPQDLFDELYIARRDYTDFVDWPVYDDEPLYPDE